MQRQPEPDYDTKARLHLGVDGQIVSWDDEKGFGFVAVETPRLAIFFHASVLQTRDLLPQKGEQVRIKAKYAEGKWTATEVTSPHRRQIHDKAAKQAGRLLQPMRDKLICIAVDRFMAAAFAVEAAQTVCGFGGFVAVECGFVCMGQTLCDA